MARTQVFLFRKTDVYKLKLMKTRPNRSISVTFCQISHSTVPAVAYVAPMD